MEFAIRRHALWIVLLSYAATASPALAERCGTQRWSLKTGTDADAHGIDFSHPHSTTIVNMIALPAPNPIPTSSRVKPIETTVFAVDATLSRYKMNSSTHGDAAYYLVLGDEQGNTIIAEIPSPACVKSDSPFASQITAARAAFESKLAAAPTFQTANIAVRVAGVGHFERFHGQSGAAPNMIELNPVLSITFDPKPQGNRRGTAGHALPTAHRRND
jgi:hypothetical protein